MRLFTAVVPPRAVVGELASVLNDVENVAWVPRKSWHITLGYYGEEDAGPRVPWIREQLKGLVAPRVSLVGVGNFGATLWMGVSAVDSSFAALGAALRVEERRPWTPHLTIGKGEPLDLAYESPEWTIDEVLLLGAELRYEYTVVERFRFAG